VLMENRNELIAEVEVLQATGTAERGVHLLMMEPIPGDHQVTVGGTKAMTVRSSWRKRET